MVYLRYYIAFLSFAPKYLGAIGLVLLLIGKLFPCLVYKDPELLFES